MRGRTPALRTESCPAPSGSTEPAWGQTEPRNPFLHPRGSAAPWGEWRHCEGSSAPSRLRTIGRPGLRAAELRCGSVQEEVGGAARTAPPCGSTTPALRAAAPGGGERQPPAPHCSPASPAALPALPALQGAPEPRSTGGPEQIITARSTSSEFALFSFLPFLTLPTAGRSALPSLQRRCSRRSALQLLVGRWGLPAPPDPRPGSSRDRTEPPAPQGRCGHRPGVDLCSQCTVVP